MKRNISLLRVTQQGNKMVRFRETLSPLKARVLLERFVVNIGTVMVDDRNNIIYAAEWLRKPENTHLYHVVIDGGPVMSGGTSDSNTIDADVRKYSDRYKRCYLDIKKTRRVCREH